MSNANATPSPGNGTPANAYRLLWAGFMAILAAGVGFAIRGGILDVWKAKFGFTGLETGLINGAGFTGFCFGIIIGGIICDKIGYGKLVIAAFAMHALSAFVTFGAMDGMSTKTAFVYLWSGTFLFAVANGTLEAVANPLVATLFFHNRTHYLNILHASWPAGMILGGLANTWVADWNWKARLALFLIPTAIYGIMFLGQHFPKSEASQKGLKLGDMFKDVGMAGSAVVAFLLALFVKDGLGPLLSGFTGSEFFGFTQTTPGASHTWFYISIAVGAAVWLAFSNLSRWATGSLLLFVLFIAHALVGAVELGTDGWIQSITNNLFGEGRGAQLFVLASIVMFLLRFCADFIEKKIGLSPVGILLACAVLACLGLNLISLSNSLGVVGGAVLVYAVGKTFYWPTMLAVASDRFPRTGAVAISFMGGIGMMSAGLIGSPGLGYAKDRFAGAELQKADAALYAQYKSEKPSKWLFFDQVNAIDGKKLGEVKSALAGIRKADPQATLDAALNKLQPAQKTVLVSDMHGDR
ncbi:MAG TPA: MFS transporter, partial [Methylomirabilota bacterium]|nr:MFS transporter [Methylomirabilota bacterium]